MDNQFHLIAIVGMPGSGKTVVSDFFRAKGIPVLRFGDQTDLGLNEQGLPLTEENERQYREHLRSQLGMAAMAIKIEPRIEVARKTSDWVVLDGLYSWEEYVYLKQKYPSLMLLLLWAPPAIRYQRIGQRKNRPLTPDQVRARDIAEIENLHKGGPIAMADYIVQNDGDEAALSAALTKFYDSQKNTG